MQLILGGVWAQAYSSIGLVKHLHDVVFIALPLLFIGTSDKDEEVDKCIKFVKDSQWVQNKGNKLLEHITTQIDNYIAELEESVNYNKR